MQLRESFDLVHVVSPSLMQGSAIDQDRRFKYSIEAIRSPNNLGEARLKSSEIRFGLIIPQGWQLDLPESLSPVEQYKLIERTGREAERIGFDSVWLYDHFHTIPEPRPYSCFECWSTLMALAKATSRLRLGEIVTSNSYRQPSYLAKIASMLDIVSNGRLEFGIGAGWYEHEYLGYGFEFPRGSVRIGMLEEAVQIIKSLWTEKVTNFEGKYYRLKEAYNYPKPVQKPHPPILIGGSGEKLTLRVVAEHADRWNGGWGVENYEHKLDVLKQHCQNVGRDFDDIEKTYTSAIFVAESTEKAIALFKNFKDHQNRLMKKKRDYDLEENMRAHVIGSQKEALEKLRKIKQLGATYFIMYMPTATDISLLRLLHEEVVKPLTE